MGQPCSSQRALSRRALAPHQKSGALRRSLCTVGRPGAAPTDPARPPRTRTAAAQLATVPRTRPVPPNCPPAHRAGPRLSIAELSTLSSGAEQVPARITMRAPSASASSMNSATPAAQRSTAQRTQQEALSGGRRLPGVLAPPASPPCPPGPCTTIRPPPAGPSTSQQAHFHSMSPLVMRFAEWRLNAARLSSGVSTAHACSKGEERGRAPARSGISPAATMLRRCFCLPS